MSLPDSVTFHAYWLWGVPFFGLGVLHDPPEKTPIERITEKGQAQATECRNPSSVLLPERRVKLQVPLGERKFK